MRLLFFLPFLALAACSDTIPLGGQTNRLAGPTAETTIAFKQFKPVKPAPPRRPNAEILRDFLDLSFQMESGRKIEHLSRFEGPITLRVTGTLKPENVKFFNADLNALLTRFRREAGIRIKRVSANSPASITIETMPRAQLQRLVPNAACFVVPRISSWKEYRQKRRSRVIEWTNLSKRETVAIFIPGDVSPQEMRDCLHEETAQALGPLNDLYRLPDSVFNDDNFHSILTGFDMLILRAYYAPEIHNGMTRTQAAAALPRVLARLNPKGQKGAGVQLSPTPRSWIEAIETALGPQTSDGARRAAAQKAVYIARQYGWVDNRLAFSLYVIGRLNFSKHTETAINAILESGAIYKSHPETRLHASHVAMHLAAYSLTAGEFDLALRLINQNLPAVVEAQNASLLATMLMIKAEILEQMGRVSEARLVLLDSLGWAGYGFGSDKVVQKRLAEIAALAPKS